MKNNTNSKRKGEVLLIPAAKRGNNTITLLALLDKKVKAAKSKS